MNELRFKKDQEIKEVYLTDESSIGVGMKNVTKITVIFENGQMAAVPWFAVWDHDIITQKFNAACILGVKL